MRYLRSSLVALAVLATFGLSGVARASLITNGDFSAGLTGWTTFTTANGTLGDGFPVVVPFDTNNDSVATASASFRVGNATGTTGDEGGGIFQTFTTGGAGTLNISADIAAQDPDGQNLDWGTFSLLLDGVVLDSHAFGGNTLPAGTALFSSLSAATLGAGTHELRILMTRPFQQSAATPVQFIDNVVVNMVPAPGSLALAAIALLGIGLARRRS